MGAIVSTITKRQSYWRDHVLAAAAFDGTIVEYATLHNLKTKDIYQWKTALTKRGFLPITKPKVEADFITVNPVDQAAPIPSDPSNAIHCRLTLPCGSVLEYFTPIEPESLSRLLSAVQSH